MKCLVARCRLPGGAVVVVRSAQAPQVLGCVVVAVADVVHVGRVHCAAPRSVEVGCGEWQAVGVVCDPGAAVPVACQGRRGGSRCASGAAGVWIGVLSRLVIVLCRHFCPLHDHSLSTFPQVRQSSRPFVLSRASSHRSHRGSARSCVVSQAHSGPKSEGNP